jgi:hypothetical protein
MGLSRATLTVAFILCAVLALSLAEQPAWAEPGARPAAQSRDALYAKCRREMFQKYGQPGVQYNRAPNQRVLPSHFVTSMTDQCVANGGRGG